MYTNADIRKLKAGRDELLAIVKAWEKWEAELIMENRSNLLDWCSTELYDQLLDLQTRRNDAIEKTEECQKFAGTNPSRGG